LTFVEIFVNLSIEIYQRSGKSMNVKIVGKRAQTDEEDMLSEKMAVGQEKVALKLLGSERFFPVLDVAKKNFCLVKPTFHYLIPYSPETIGQCAGQNAAKKADWYLLYILPSASKYANYWFFDFSAPFKDMPLQKQRETILKLGYGIPSHALACDAIRTVYIMTDKIVVGRGNGYNSEIHGLIPIKLHDIEGVR
jgi:hypothetical protein